MKKIGVAFIVTDHRVKIKLQKKRRLGLIAMRVRTKCTQIASRKIIILNSVLKKLIVLTNFTFCLQVVLLYRDSWKHSSAIPTPWLDVHQINPHSAPAGSDWQCFRGLRAAARSPFSLVGGQPGGALREKHCRGVHALPPTSTKHSSRQHVNHHVLLSLPSYCWTNYRR